LYFCNLISCLAIDGLIRFFALGKLLFCRSKVYLHFGRVGFQFDWRVTVSLIASFYSSSLFTLLILLSVHFLKWNYQCFSATLKCSQSFSLLFLQVPFVIDHPYY